VSSQVKSLDLVNKILESMYSMEEALQKAEKRVEEDATKLVALAEEYSRKFQAAADEFLAELRRKVDEAVAEEIKKIEWRYEEERKKKEAELARLAEANMDKAVRAALEELLGALRG